MLTATQIGVIKKSWRSFRGMDPILFGDVFYSKLFLEHPSIKHPFHISKAEQSRKFVEMLNVIVGRLDKWHELDAEVKQLGQRHAQYGVKPQHYKAVGNALLWTLQQGLGVEWTPDVQEAWQACFDELASSMMHATEVAK